MTSLAIYIEGFKLFIFSDLVITLSVFYTKGVLEKMSGTDVFLSVIYNSLNLTVMKPETHICIYKQRSTHFILAVTQIQQVLNEYFLSE